MTKVQYDQIECKAFYLRRPTGQRVRLQLLPEHAGALTGRVTRSCKLAVRLPAPHDAIEIVQNERLTRDKEATLEAALQALGGELVNV